MFSELIFEQYHQINWQWGRPPQLGVKIIKTLSISISHSLAPPTTRQHTTDTLTPYKICGVQ
jgi:hypothetical protein